MRELGEHLARLLAGLLKLTKVHSPDNRAFDDPVREVVRSLGELIEVLGPVNLVTVEDQVYVNDIRIRTDPKSGSALGPDLHRHEIGGLTFHAPIDGPALRKLISVLAADPAKDDPRGAVAQALRQQGLGAVETEGVFHYRTGGEDRVRDPEEVAARLYLLAADTLDNLASGRALNPLPLRRMVLEVLDTNVAAPAFWAPPPPELPVHVGHAVQVAVLSLIVARLAKFPPAFLQDLGIAAIVHDIGYFAPDVDGAPNALSRHPLEGARVLLRQRGFQEGKLRRLRAMLEHHRDAGQPGPRSPSPAGLILRVAEDYATAVRLLSARALRADILGAMGHSTDHYHPAVVQLLVNALGKHPPGTIVELAGGRFARVACPARAPELWDAPLLAVLDRASGALTTELLDAMRGAQIVRAIPG